MEKDSEGSEDERKFVCTASILGITGADEPLLIHGIIKIQYGCFYFKSETGPFEPLRICIPIDSITAKLNSLGVLTVEDKEQEVSYQFNYIDDPTPLVSEINEWKQTGSPKIVMRNSRYNRNVGSFMNAFEESIKIFSTETISKKKGEVFDSEMIYYITKGTLTVLVARDKTKIATLQAGDIWEHLSAVKDEYLVIATSDTIAKVIPCSLLHDENPQKPLVLKEQQLRQFLFYFLAISKAGRLRRLINSIATTYMSINQVIKQNSSSLISKINGKKSDDKTVSALSFLRADESIIQNVPCVQQRKGFTKGNVSGRIILTDKRFWFISSATIWGEAIDLDIYYNNILEINELRDPNTFSVTTTNNTTHKFSVKLSAVFANLLSVLKYQRKESEKAGNNSTTDQILHGKDSSSLFGVNKLRLMFPNAETRLFLKGIEIVKQEIRSKAFYFVIDGKVVEKNNSCDKIMGSFLQSDMLGIVSALEQGITNTAVVAEEESNILIIPFKSFYKSKICRKFDENERVTFITDFYRMLNRKLTKILNLRARQYSEMFDYLENSFSTKVNYVYLENCCISTSNDKKRKTTNYFLSITSSSLILEQVGDKNKNKIVIELMDIFNFWNTHNSGDEIVSNSDMLSSQHDYFSVSLPPLPSDSKKSKCCYLTSGKKWKALEWYVLIDSAIQRKNNCCNINKTAKEIILNELYCVHGLSAGIIRSFKGDIEWKATKKVQGEFVVECMVGKDKGVTKFFWNGHDFTDEEGYIHGKWDGIVAEWYVAHNSLPLFSYIYDAKQSMFRSSNRHQKVNFINKYMIFQDVSLKLKMQWSFEGRLPHQIVLFVHLWHLTPSEKETLEMYNAKNSISSPLLTNRRVSSGKNENSQNNLMAKLAEGKLHKMTSADPSPVSSSRRRSANQLSTLELVESMERKEKRELNRASSCGVLSELSRSSPNSAAQKPPHFQALIRLKRSTSDPQTVRKVNFIDKEKVISSPALSITEDSEHIKRFKSINRKKKSNSMIASTGSKMEFSEPKHGTVVLKNQILNILNKEINASEDSSTNEISKEKKLPVNSEEKIDKCLSEIEIVKTEIKQVRKELLTFKDELFSKIDNALSSINKLFNNNNNINNN